MTKLQCHFKERSEQKPLNVADKFILSCTSDSPLALGEGLQFVFKDKESQYQIHSLGYKSNSSTGFELIVVGYKPGEYANQELHLTDGITTLTTNPLSWKVESVLNPQEPPEPVPSKGPVELEYPLWFWISLAAFILVLSSAIGYYIYAKKRRAKIKQQLESYTTMLSPFAQFSKDLRTTKREIDMQKSNDRAYSLVEQLDKDFRLYLIRELKVPALQTSRRQLLKEIKRDHPNIYENLNAELRRVLNEFERAVHDKEKIKLKDCEDLWALSRMVVEKVNEFRRKHK